MVNNENAYADGYRIVGSTSVGFEIPQNTKPVRAYVTVETAAIRFRYIGKNADSSIGGGHLVNAGGEFVVEGSSNILNFQMIADTATAADVFYTLERS